MGTLGAVRISEGARLAGALRDAISQADASNIESATSRYTFYLCHVIHRRVVQRWSGRPVSFRDDFDWWTDGVADAVVRYFQGDFSTEDSWRHTDAAGKFDVAGAIIDLVWNVAVASWRIKGSEAELTALHQRVVHIMS